MDGNTFQSNSNIANNNLDGAMPPFAPSYKHSLVPEEREEQALSSQQQAVNRLMDSVNESRIQHSCMVPEAMQIPTQLPPEVISGYPNPTASYPQPVYRYTPTPYVNQPAYAYSPSQYASEPVYAYPSSPYASPPIYSYSPAPYANSPIYSPPGYAAQPVYTYPPHPYFNRPVYPRPIYPYANQSLSGYPLSPYSNQYVNQYAIANLIRSVAGAVSEIEFTSNLRRRW